MVNLVTHTHKPAGNSSKHNDHLFAERIKARTDSCDSSKDQTQCPYIYNAKQWDLTVNHFFLTVCRDKLSSVNALTSNRRLSVWLTKQDFISVFGAA